MNWTRVIDSVIAAVAPETAARRAYYRETLAASGKLSSESNPNNASVDSEQHPDNDLIPDTPNQRRRCTLAFLNNAAVNGIVKSQVRRIIGSLTIQANTGDSETDAAIEAEWQRRLDDGLHDALKLGALHLLVDGGFVPHIIGKFSDPLDIEIIPYRLIEQPTDRRPTDPALTSAGYIRDGFEYRDGKQVACYVKDEFSVWNSVTPRLTFQRVPLISHPCLERLSGQSRGLSWYSAAITRLDLINRWTLATLTAAELHAYMVALCAGKTPDAGGLSGIGAYSTDSSTLQRVMTYARQHRILFLPGNVDWKLIQANAPNVADFLESQFRIVARQLGVSYERLTYDLSKTSFSSTKFGDRDDRLTAMDQQELFIVKVLQPLHARLVDGMVLRGELPNADQYAVAREQYLRVRFTLPGQPPVDEMKAEEATAAALANRTASRTRICANRGDDAEEIVQEIMREDRMFFDVRKAFWLECGYTDEEARDMARNEILDPNQEIFGASARSEREETPAGESETQPETSDERKPTARREAA